MWMVVAVAAAWGLRATILEGFVYAWPRQFRGDFYNAMFGPWDGEGIYYGPVFVMERWLVEAAPTFFNEYFFALLDIPLILLAFAFAAGAARLSWGPIFVAAAAWLCYRYLYYAFSVAANPEIIELTLLCGAWFAVSRERHSMAFAAVAVGALTKRIPILFLPLLLLTQRTRGALVGSLAAGVLVSLLIAVVVGIGQAMSPLDVVAATFPVGLPFSGRRDVVEVLAQPFTEGGQFLGLSNALARSLGLPMNDRGLPFIQGVYYAVTTLVVATAIGIAYALLRSKVRIPWSQGGPLAFGIFFALMPLAAVTTHPHTFVFLLPVWTAIIGLVPEDDDSLRRRAVLALSAACYVLIGLPAAVKPIDLLLRTDLAGSAPFTDPIWANLILIIGLFGYALHLLRSHQRADRGPSRAVMS